MNDLGRRAEDLACAFLTRQGYQVLARNFRAGPREIDIIARRGALIIFVEVKARQRRGAIYSVTRRKQHLLAAAAQHWTHTHGEPSFEYRFDVIAIHWRGRHSTIEHIENAWRI